MSPLRKRFYKEAAIGSADGGFAVCLDGRPVRTPKGNPLILPSQALAQAVVDEWASQGDKIQPETMPLMQLAATAIDRVAPERPALQENLLRYAETDLLCYRASHPADLARLQTERWQPVLDWAALHLDAPLNATGGLTPIDQPPPALKALGAYLDGLDVWRLTTVSVATSATGSLLLALALLENFLDAERLIAASQLDETYQQALWGSDDEALERQKGLAEEIAAAEAFLKLL